MISRSELAHAGDDGLARLLVGVDLEGRVLLGELLQADGQLVLLSLGLGLDGDVDNRIREVHGLEDDGMVLIAKRLAGGGVLQADDGNDVACLAVVDVDLLGCVHLEQAADALALAADGVIRVGAGIQATGVDADVGELADERIGHDLERQSGERGLLVGLARLGLLGVGVGALDCRDVKRARQVVDDGVEQLLDALVLVG